jgi:hypothetical protein
MKSRATFAALLDEHMQVMGWGADRLAEASGIPRQTIVGWRSKGKHPRQWKDVLKVAAALSLSDSQVDELLQAAKHPPLEKLLRSSFDEEAKGFLARWADAVNQRQEASTERIATVSVAESHTQQLPSTGVSPVPQTARFPLTIIIQLCILLLLGLVLYRLFIPTDTKIPGGQWVSPSRDFVVTNDRLHFAAHAYDNPRGSGIESVKFTAFYSDTWSIACTATTPRSGTDIYECAWPLSSVPPGPIRVSFDVYDKAGNYNKAPHGMRPGELQR